MGKKPIPVDFNNLRAINSAADFYGWKTSIVEAIAKTDAEYAKRIEGINSLMDLFNLKEEILVKLGVSE